MTSPPETPTIRCQDEPDGPVRCECATLFGVTSEHLTQAQLDNVFDHQGQREWALIELLVRTVDLALHLGFTGEQTTSVVQALMTDDTRRFNGRDDVTVAVVTPQEVLNQIRLYAAMT